MKYPSTAFYIMPATKCNPFPWSNPSYKPKPINQGITQGMFNYNGDHDKIDYGEDQEQTEE